MVRYATEMPRMTDLVVIGGGVLGAATAFFASRAGLHAVVIERRRQLGTLTTAASAGGVRAQFDNADEVALMLRSIALFGGLAERADLELSQRGYLWVTTSDEGARRQARLGEQQRDWGLADAELLDGDAAR